MSKRTKYVPKHRHAPEPRVPAERAPRKALRNVAAMSSVAVAVTGIAVGGGVLGDAVSVSSAADDVSTTLTSSGATASSDVARDRETTSRSFDRRGDTDPAKEAALSADSGPAVTRSVALADGDPRDIAKALMPTFGFGSDQFGCLESLWDRESHWNPLAHNPSSGAHGIPQALPGSKMASAGPDWESNPVTQITWGLGYIQDRYGSPCGAWAHSQSHGWY